MNLRKHIMADWKMQLAAIKTNPVANITNTTADPNVKLKALVKTVRKLDDECRLVISSKQQDWLDDLFEQADNGAWGRFSANSIKFLETCASGFYTETKLPGYHD